MCDQRSVSGALSNRKHGLFPTRYYENGPLEPGYSATTFKIQFGENYFVLGLPARDIANHSFEHTFDPGLKPLE